MKLLKLALAPIAAVAMMASSVPASAATWILNVWGGSGNPGSGPWGEVTATDVGNDINVVVSLYNPPTLGFVDTGVHNTFTFSLSNAATATVTNLSWGAAGLNGSFQNPNFGSFTNAIMCTVNCGSGGNNFHLPPLTFTIHDDNGIALSNFIMSTGGAQSSFFAADILSNGFTGAVGTNTPAIPEPETYAMMLVGFSLLGFVARRRKQALGNVVPA